MKKILKYALTAVGVFAVAFVGVYLGMMIRGASAHQPAEQTADHTNTLLNTGGAFPDVDLMTPESTLVKTSSLYAGSGSVFLFMELGCPPCATMSEKWQKLIADGTVTPKNVYGVVIEPAHSAEMYRKKNGLAFSIYSDTAMTFIKKYLVTEFPLCVIVGRSGKIHLQTYDPNREITSKELAGYLKD